MGENTNRKKRDREDPDDRGHVWDEYEILISPVQTETYTETRLPKRSRYRSQAKYDREKENRPGFRKKPKCQGIPKESGIYELGLVKLRDPDTAVLTSIEIKWVYVGKSKNLFQRLVRGYANSGSHKQEDIKLAINDGYTIVCRYKKMANGNIAREEEKKILENYNYEWNIQENKGKKREKNLLPCCLQTSVLN